MSALTSRYTFNADRNMEHEGDEHDTGDEDDAGDKSDEDGGDGENGVTSATKTANIENATMKVYIYLNTTIKGVIRTLTRK